MSFTIALRVGSNDSLTIGNKKGAEGQRQGLTWRHGFESRNIDSFRLAHCVLAIAGISRKLKYGKMRISFDSFVNLSCVIYFAHRVTDRIDFGLPMNIPAPT